MSVRPRVPCPANPALMWAFEKHMPEWNKKGLVFETARHGVGGTQRDAMERAVPERPWRGPSAGGHPEAAE